MKIRIGMRELDDTDKEKIKLGIKTIEEYEQNWIVKALYENIREIEMTPDEWRKVVENLPYMGSSSSRQIYISGNGNEIYHPYNSDRITRADGIVTISGHYVDTYTAAFIIDLLQHRTYELYQEPQQPAPQPQVPEQIRENKIRELEKDIADVGKSLDLLVELDLPAQVKAHNEQLSYLRKKLGVVKAGYEYKIWDDRKYKSGSLEAYEYPIPYEVLQALKKAKSKRSDEMCRCHHVKSKHMGGVCSLCECPFYTFAGWVYKEVLALRNGDDVLQELRRTLALKELDTNVFVVGVDILKIAEFSVSVEVQYTYDD